MSGKRLFTKARHRNERLRESQNLNPATGFLDQDPGNGGSVPAWSMFT